MSIARQKSTTGAGTRSDRAAVVVAVKACKEIPRAALTWALTNVARPGDCVTLLVVVPTHTSGKRLWGFPSFHHDCTVGHWRIMSGTAGEQKEYIADLCKQMMTQLRDIYDPEKVTVKMRVVHESSEGVVASEAKRVQTQWVVLDRQLKKEANFCTEKLDCNVIVVKHSEPKVLQLNLIEPRHTDSNPKPETINVPNKTTSNSDQDKLSSRTSRPPSQDYSFSDSALSSSRSTSMCSNLSFSEEGSRHSKPRNALEEIYTSPESCRNVREMISFRQNAPLDSPPLCSVCHHKTPSFGKPPRMFSYSELEDATNGFSEANFLAEGGYGCVHRGVLPQGQVVAVKQHVLASGKGDREFCSEVGILSCAQHRNVVMLIGYCADDGRRLLVYEYICNGSLDSHLYGVDKRPLEWGVRQKIAVGAARGLRYLHEECRVGCIVHRDMRPNNILLTHDFEPLVGDFGLARLLAEGQSGEASRIMGTIGYMAPEYAQTGQVCEKADVYSFGVVLVELVTGRKAMDKSRPKGQKCLTEWARPLLEENGLSEHVDPRLLSCYVEKEVEAMLHCASLCLQRDPQSRPRMSQVLRMLEGDVLM